MRQFGHFPRQFVVLTHIVTMSVRLCYMKRNLYARTGGLLGYFKNGWGRAKTEFVIPCIPLHFYPHFTTYLVHTKALGGIYYHYSKGIPVTSRGDHCLRPYLHLIDQSYVVSLLLRLHSY